jgi:hypothetical protein
MKREHPPDANDLHNTSTLLWRYMDDRIFTKEACHRQPFWEGGWLSDLERKMNQPYNG